MSTIFDSNDLKKLRKGGKILADIIFRSKSLIKESANLLDIDRFVESEIIKAGCRPSFKGFEGYPATTCLSINHEIVHAIPKSYILKSGDLLGLDVGLWYENIAVDTAITVAIGDISKRQQELLLSTQQALKKAIRIIKPGIRTGDIGYCIQKIAENHKLGIIRNLSGHGVGYKVHDYPSILNFGRPNQGELIKEGMVLAIEPMFTLGRGEVKTAIDGWAVETVDHSYAAQFEHTILVQKSSAEIITSR